MTSAIAPLGSHLVNHHLNMSTFPQDRPFVTPSGFDNTAHYSRPTGPTATPTGPSPDRYPKQAVTPQQHRSGNHSSAHSPYQSTSDLNTSYAQPQAQPPITPLSASHYGPNPPASSSSGSYFGVAQTPTDQAIPSPPPTGTSRPGSSNANFTPDGVPIVPVGVSGGKMFRCRGYGECDKVFTRSEHLARHVR